MSVCVSKGGEQKDVFERGQSALFIALRHGCGLGVGIGSQMERSNRKRLRAQPQQPGTGCARRKIPSLVARNLQNVSATALLSIALMKFRQCSHLGAIQKTRVFGLCTGTQFQRWDASTGGTGERFGSEGDQILVCLFESRY